MREGGSLSFDPEKEARQILNSEAAPEARDEAVEGGPGEFLGHEQRKHRLERFKDALESQQRGIAAAVRELYSLVKSNPDADYRQLMEVAAKVKEGFRLTDAQVGGFASAIEEFLDRRRNLKEVSRRFTDAGMLFEACFGLKPQGPVEASYNAMTVTIICHYQTDYIAARRRASTLGGRQVTAEELERYKESDGAAIEEVGLAELKGCVILEKPQSYGKGRSGLSEHEQQHKFNELFVPPPARPGFGQSELDAIAKNGESEYARTSSIAMRLARNFRRQSIDPLAREEIMAYYRQGAGAPDIYYTLLKSPLYAFAGKQTMEKVKGDIITGLNRLSGMAGAAGGEVADRYSFLARIDMRAIEEGVESAFRQDYEKSLFAYCKAVSDMENSGYSREQIISYLHLLPAGKWPRLAHRLTKAGLNRET